MVNAQYREYVHSPNAREGGGGGMVLIQTLIDFSEGLICLRFEWKLYTSRNSNREQLRKIHQLQGPLAGIEPTPVPAGGPYS